MITKQEAVKIVEKLGLKPRKGKELFYKLVHNGITILTTAIPKGKGPLVITDQFRKQLRLDRDQLEGARKCPFKEADYLRHLVAIGRIPEEDNG